MTEVNKLAVKSCDKEGLGFLLDPFACNYDPAKDAAALCAGVVGEGVVGANLETKTCVNLAEARVINKVWYGATTDGSYDANESVAARSGKALGSKQLWWSYPRGSDWSGLISSVGGTEALAVALSDIRYATAASNLVNPITERERWRTLDFAGLADAQAKSLAQQPQLGNVNTDSADLTKLQKLGRKIVTYNGLGEEVIPPTVSTNHFERVAASMGGVLEVQKFLRLYLVPAKAHSSQGRAYTVSGQNNTVPLPKLPGAGNQNPTREQDHWFCQTRARLGCCAGQSTQSA
jgi:feruloyl esterase